MAHDNDHTHGANETRLGITALLTGGFMFAELFGGFLSGSLALIADAGHMAIDFASLALAWLAFRIARRPADWRWTYGYDRVQILVAFANGLVLFPVAAWIIWEALERLMEPAPVLGGLMLWVAGGGLLVNLAAFFILHGAERDNVNIRGALLHVLGDLLGSVGAIAAAVIIILSGWTPIDPILSIIVSLIILAGAWRLVRDAGRILLEAAPANLDAAEIAPALKAAIPVVKDIHHVHVWSITEKMRAVTLHACVDDAADGPSVVRDIKAVLAERFQLSHVTVEIEHGECSDPVAECRHDNDRVHAHEHEHDHGREPGRHQDHAHHSHMTASPA